ncbi:MAG: protocatechuate 3,4-dioxygenase subunit alpha [Acidimicrobiales bacterium]
MADRLGLTPPQTVGPFLHIVLDRPEDRFAARDAAPGAQPFVVRGRLIDGDGVGVPDGLVESWQIDGHFGRCVTGANGEWELHSVLPPPAPTRAGPVQAPHLCLSVFARGLLDRVITRCYFSDLVEANAVDPVLSRLDPGRRATLVAGCTGRTAGGGSTDPVRSYRFDVRLQGDDETVFFEL